LLAIVHTGYIIACWLRAGVFEPVVMLPAVLASRIAYATGLSVGVIRWIGARRRPAKGPRPSPRWQ
jgi:hypothetical protein